MNKKWLPHIVAVGAFVVFIVLGLACATSAPSQPQEQRRQPAPSEPQQQQVASTADRTTPQQAAPASQYWSGNGGRGMTLAVLEPSGNGLSADELRWMPSTVQGSITGDFNRFSVMTIIDRQNLERILDEQGQSMSGNYSDDDYISIGKLTNARYILAGSITKTANAYMLELAVTDVQTGERKASYSPTPVSSQALENLSAVKEATADLLRQLGVTLTTRGRQELTRTVDTATAQAEIALARGITAQREGLEVEALSYFLQANSYGTGIEEVENRLKSITASIASASAGADARNDIVWRRQWIERLQETETFYRNYTRESQPYFLLYGTDISHGTINYQNEKVELSIGMRLVPDVLWAITINETILTVERNLKATGRADTWGLDWPDNSVTMPSPFASRTGNFAVVVEITNDQGRSLGRQTVAVPYGFDVRYGMTSPKQQWEGTATVPGVDIKLITDQLTVKIISVDGVPAETATSQRRINIMPMEEYSNMARLRTSGAATDESLFTVNNDGAITGYTGRQTTLSIPSTVRGVFVTRIGNQAFQSKGLTSVTIPNGVRIIGRDAFSSNQLTSVTIPNSVRTIENGAFGHNRFTNLTIPDSVRTIENRAFGYIDAITSVTVGADVDMDGDAFRGHDIDTYYNQSGKRAGTYRRSGSGFNVTWTYSPR